MHDSLDWRANDMHVLGMCVDNQLRYRRFNVEWQIAMRCDDHQHHNQQLSGDGEGTTKRQVSVWCAQREADCAKGATNLKQHRHRVVAHN